MLGRWESKQSPDCDVQTFNMSSHSSARLGQVVLSSGLPAAAAAAAAAVMLCPL